MSDWIILRCSGPSTLRLVQSLTAAGYEVWSPVEVLRRRKPRVRVHVERAVAIMPTYVFARAGHLDELVELSMALTSPHPGFSVFRARNHFPMIADRDIEPLRVAERRACPKEMARVFNPGETIHIEEGGFAGMTGTIQEHRGRFVMVLFPGFSIPVKIEGAVLPVKNAA